MEAVSLYAGDVASAGMAALLVSPFITIVDRSIIENASGRQKLQLGLKQYFRDFTAHPMQFMRQKQFLLIYGLYTSTYVTANVIDTSCELMDKENQMPKFIGTTAVNMTLCIAKDREFTRMFGVIAPSSVPLATFGLFAIRDAMTVAGSFNLPKVVSKDYIQPKTNLSSSTADTASQLLCPALIQFLSTPMHLLGLDLYNNKNKPANQRMQFISKEYLKSTCARIARIGPAFGIGGIGNKYFRDSYRGKTV